MSKPKSFTYDDIKTFFDARNGKWKTEAKIANNTWLYDYQDHYCVELHDKKIAKFYEDGIIVLNLCGYYTRTTLDRMRMMFGYKVRFITDTINGRKCVYFKDLSGNRQLLALNTSGIQSGWIHMRDDRFNQGIVIKGLTLFPGADHYAADAYKRERRDARKDVIEEMKNDPELMKRTEAYVSRKVAQAQIDGVYDDARKRGYEEAKQRFTFLLVGRYDSPFTEDMQLNTDSPVRFPAWKNDYSYAKNQLKALVEIPQPIGENNE